MNKQKKRLGSMSLCKVVLICLFLSVFSTAWAAVEQTSSKITVTGVVKDVQGEPLIGATIKIKGSAVGTISAFTSCCTRLNQGQCAGEWGFRVFLCRYE